MALLSFVESAPRAYRLKASNAAPPFSTSAGTSACSERTGVSGVSILCVPAPTPSHWSVRGFSVLRTVQAAGHRQTPTSGGLHLPQIIPRPDLSCSFCADVAYKLPTLASPGCTSCSNRGSRTSVASALGSTPYCLRHSLSTRASTTLADLLTPLLVANPFSAIRATLLRWLGDEFEDGLTHGWQGWLRR
jgi:hypothetical protein